MNLKVGEYYSLQWGNFDFQVAVIKYLGNNKYKVIEASKKTSDKADELCIIFVAQYLGNDFCKHLPGYENRLKALKLLDLKG